jgi:hypothetical protein
VTLQASAEACVFLDLVRTFGAHEKEAIMNARQVWLGIGMAFCAFLVGTPARADVIDGDWCHEDGRHFSIAGPSIVTPAGQRTQGDYTRHSFRYTVPANDPGAGQDIFMRLLNEMTLSLQNGPDGASQIWHRCKPTTS